MAPVSLNLRFSTKIRFEYDFEKTRILGKKSHFDWWRWEKKISNENSLLTLDKLQNLTSEVL